MTDTEVAATMEDAAAMAVRLLEFINHAARHDARNPVHAAHDPVSIGYNRAINDISFYVVEGNPLPPEDA